MIESLKESPQMIKFNSLAIQAVERPSSAENRSKGQSDQMNHIRRQRTFKVNFQTRQEMEVAMKILRKSTSSQSDEHLKFQVRSIAPPEEVREEPEEEVESVKSQDGGSSKDEEVVDGVDDLESIESVSNHSEVAPRTDLNVATQNMQSEKSPEKKQSSN